MKNLPRRIILSLLLTGFLLASFTFKEVTLTVPEYSDSAVSATYLVHLAFPQFEGEDLPPIVAELNHKIRTEADDACNQFIKNFGGETPYTPPADGNYKDRLSGSYEVSILNENLLSLEISHHFNHIESEDHEYFQQYFYNLSLKEGKMLSVEECFRLKTSEKEWLAFVEQMGFSIDRKYPLPESFLVYEGGVRFYFKRVDEEHSYMWEEIEPYFEISYVR